MGKSVAKSQGGGNVGKLTVPSELSLGRNIVLVLLHCDCWSFETD